MARKLLFAPEAEGGEQRVDSINRMMNEAVNPGVLSSQRIGNDT